MVPPVAALWLQAAEHTAHDLSSLELLQVGGAKLSPQLAREVRPVLGCRVQQVFGMTEGLLKGELVAGGDGVAVGYLNDPDLTAERFIPDPFSDDPAARLYRTGSRQLA